MASDFEGRTALVTGGSSGIGAATVALLAARGARVAVFDLDANSVPDGVLGIEGDVTDSAAADAAVEQVSRALGALDVLVCCAGVAGESLRTVDIPDEEWKRVFAINADGVLWFNRAAARVMVPRGSGRIVNVASIAGKEGNPMAAAYSASKAAVIGLTKAIGRDLADSGVLVNCIAPAVIATPILEQISQEHIDYMVSRIPMARLGRPEEVAELIAFLASDAMSFSTGATFDISGGRATFQAGLTTPSWPYPEHPSGLSAVGAATVGALQSFLGTDDVAFGTTNTAPVNPVTRSYTRLSQAIDEIVDARVWSGIHFRTADEQGAAIGRRVAHWAARHVFGARTRHRHRGRH